MKIHIVVVMFILALSVVCVNVSGAIRMYRLPYPDVQAEVHYIDLDQDGDPDVLRTTTHKETPIQWIDDDDDMKEGELAGDMDSDCLMIDKNKDGQYGGFHDLIVDRGDENGDGKADIEVIADNAGPKNTGWGPGHYIITVDVDGDGVFNYIDWRDFKLKCWEHSGLSHFFQDYIGDSLFIKMHSSTYNVKNLKYNWENPFLFYDKDQDGVTEMAIRLYDTPKVNQDKNILMPQNADDLTDQQRCMEFTKKIEWASLTFDLDNDAASGNEFDYDMTINFYGGGFDYSDQVHSWKSLTGIREADQYFYDARWRKLNQLIYPDHEAAWDLVFKRGQWEHARFVYDEDDDCQRWERVELYHNKNPFKIGANRGGLDDNSQSDPSGDRGEWDEDNSGKGKLYIGMFDGRLHLYGAELGYWRIDQDAKVFQGYSRVTKGRQSDRFETMKFTDSDNNGFFDTIDYDLDADQKFEEQIELKALGLDDQCQVIETANLSYSELTQLHEQLANALWQRAREAVEIADNYDVDTACYSGLKAPDSIREKYHYGYWLNHYIYSDLIYLSERNKDDAFKTKVKKAYFGNNWKILK